MCIFSLSPQSNDCLVYDSVSRLSTMPRNDRFSVNSVCNQTFLDLQKSVLTLSHIVGGLAPNAKLFQSALPPGETVTYLAVFWGLIVTKMASEIRF